MCLECGFYKDKVVLDLGAKKKSREDRIAAKKEIVKGQTADETPAAEVVTK
jgi:hypothetical protein